MGAGFIVHLRNHTINAVRTSTLIVPLKKLHYEYKKSTAAGDAKSTGIEKSRSAAGGHDGSFKAIYAIL